MVVPGKDFTLTSIKKKAACFSRVVPLTMIKAYILLSPIA